mmetsp:Transcript_54673/g.175348  ORF Transcript_54673/g.175348 Transcript_54673/m.175348 type:complete len:307 (-) Transcript_54673:7-927(-)
MQLRRQAAGTRSQHRREPGLSSGLRGFVQIQAHGTRGAALRAQLPLQRAATPLQQVDARVERRQLHGRASLGRLGRLMLLLAALARGAGLGSRRPGGLLGRRRRLLPSRPRLHHRRLRVHSGGLRRRLVLRSQALGLLGLLPGLLQLALEALLLRCQLLLRLPAQQAVLIRVLPAEQLDLSLVYLAVPLELGPQHLHLLLRGRGAALSGLAPRGELLDLLREPGDLRLQLRRPRLRRRGLLLRRLRVGVARALQGLAQARDLVRQHPLALLQLRRLLLLRAPLLPLGLQARAQLHAGLPRLLQREA